MHRFMIAPGASVGDVIALNDAESHHALRVLRLTEGAQIELSDGQGRLFGAQIISIDDGVHAKLTAELAGAEPPVQLTLYQGLPKFDKLELICQKATELGACRIVPVKTARTVVKLDDKDGLKRRDRMQKICAEAAKQCGRAAVPEVVAPVTFAAALEMMYTESLMIMPWEEARGLNMTRLHSEHPNAPSIGIFIGPEGGISSEECEQLKALGAISVTLGKRILRTETAGLCALSVIWASLGEM